MRFWDDEEETEIFVSEAFDLGETFETFLVSKMLFFSSFFVFIIVVSTHFPAIEWADYLFPIVVVVVVVVVHESSFHLID